MRIFCSNLKISVWRALMGRYNSEKFCPSAYIYAVWFQSAWWVAAQHQKAAWRSIIGISGVLCVMTFGTMLMPKWCVGNLASKEERPSTATGSPGAVNKSGWNPCDVGKVSRRCAVWASYQIRKIASCACAWNAGNDFPRGLLQRKPLVSDPGMHHDTCVTHVPWCMSVSLTCGGGENVPSIPGACAPVILRIWQEVHCHILKYPCKHTTE